MSKENEETDADEQLRMVIQRLARRIRAERAGESISDTQLGVLWRLRTDGATTPGELATAERVSAPSMNRTLNALEASGFVRRDPSDDDARKVRVTLTPAGEHVIAETRRLRRQWFHSRLEELTASERAALEAARPVLDRLADA
ncbi:MarR family winged helix-turn-helix transcriptional regulator [Microcella sp.]|uniref:MarR family winged helix-turn-helix transcriptional regulator n=1 Tax=Microcella sp. TaxID=1913979 RepID=UPI0025EA6865|nr:MarR family transcriptional regulator [Microcella sp.]